MTTQTEQDSGGENVYPALARAQAAFPAIPMTGDAQYGKFASLADIRSAVTPALTEEGLALTQRMVIRPDASWVLITAVVHGATGTLISSEYPLPLREKPHPTGSAITYARRYSTTALLNVVGEKDDDGDAAQKAAPAPGTPAEVDAMLPVEHPDQAEADGWKAWAKRMRETIQQATSVHEIDTILASKQSDFLNAEEALPKLYAWVVEIIDKRKSELAEPPPPPADDNPLLGG